LWGAVRAAPPFLGYTPSPRRTANLYLNRLEHYFVRTRLWSKPLKLIVEPLNACNLRCPGCFTGAGGTSRPRSAMSMALYHALLRELGSTLFELEAFNWGEPLLNPAIEEMIAAATARGIATKLNTNFSLPFDDTRARRLVRAGLTTLTVSIDGAGQESYARYRVRGELAAVLANCRRITRAKQRIGSALPRLNWEFHVFPHNVGDVPAVRAMAAELGMTLLLFKGTVPGADWDLRGDWSFCVEPQAMPCASLWSVAVVNNDGGVAPCNGTFYREDDVGALRFTPESLATAGFDAVWNGPRMQAARGFYRQRTARAAGDREHVCLECPQTRGYERWVAHQAAGGSADTFNLGYTTNDGWNYFWNRRPARPGGHQSRWTPPPAATRRR
jgi:hypothetical protein